MWNTCPPMSALMRDGHLLGPGDLARFLGIRQHSVPSSDADGRRVVSGVITSVRAAARETGRAQYVNVPDRKMAGSTEFQR